MDMTLCMQPATGTIGVEHGHIVWRFSPDDAEMIAEAIERRLPPMDLAHKDVDALRDAAELARKNGPAR